MLKDTSLSSGLLHHKTKWLLAWIAVSTILLSSLLVLWWHSDHHGALASYFLLWLPALTSGTLAGTVAIMRALRKKSLFNTPPGLVPVDTLPDTGEVKLSLPGPPLPILGGWAATGIARNAPDFVRALASRKARPTPDDTLTDHEGFPLLTGRAKYLNPVNVLDHLVQANGYGSAPNASKTNSVGEPSTGWVRSIALLDALIEQVLRDWPYCSPHDGRQGNRPPVQDTTTDVPQAPTPDRFILEVRLIVPCRFDDRERTLAQRFVSDRLDVPFKSAASTSLELLAAEDDATALRLMERFRSRYAEMEQPAALLLLACDSTLCPTVAAKWDLQRQLFEPRRPDGRMPGEGAFAVLCANKAALTLTVGSAVCQMTALSVTRRHSSTDGPAHGAHGAHSSLVQVIASALRSAGIPGKEITSAVCDADHRARCFLECLQAMSVHTPQLDPIQARLSTNEACGHLGAASVAALLVAGIIQVRDSAPPVLIFNVDHPDERAAAILVSPDHPATSSPSLAV